MSFYCIVLSLWGCCGMHATYTVGNKRKIFLPVSLLKRTALLSRGNSTVEVPPGVNCQVQDELQHLEQQHNCHAQVQAQGAAQTRQESVTLKVETKLFSKLINVKQKPYAN